MSDVRDAVLERIAALQPVPRGTVERLDQFVALVTAENAQQNLIAPSTVETIWDRHVLDSIQLLPLAAEALGDWCDIGSGAGFPGMIVGIVSDRPVTLVEPRALRARFLESAVDALGLQGRVTVHCCKIEALNGPFPAVISARAVANLDSLLSAASHLSTENTLWLLPKGRQAENELSIAAQAWHLDMRTVPSMTDPDSRILCGHVLGRRKGVGRGTPDGKGGRA